MLFRYNYGVFMVFMLCLIVLLLSFIGWLIVFMLCVDDMLNVFILCLWYVYCVDDVNIIFIYIGILILICIIVCKLN